MTKVLIVLQGCTGWSSTLLFANNKNKFFHDVAKVEGSKKLNASEYDEEMPHSQMTDQPMVQRGRDT